MNIICSPAGIVDIEHPGQGVMDIEAADFCDVLFDTAMCCLPDVLEHMERVKTYARLETIKHPEKLYEKMKGILDECADSGVHMTTAYAPYLCRDTGHAELKPLLMQLIEESIKASGKAGCKYIVIRPWFADVKSGEEWQVNREYYLHFASLAKENDVLILLENQCKDVNGHLVRGICTDALEAATWIEQLNAEVGEERFGFCMDVGVNTLCGQNMYDFICTIGAHLKAVMVRDCNETMENAMLPFTNVGRHQSHTDWLNLIRGLREIDFDGQFIMNLTDTAFSFSPMLRPTLLQLAKSVADFLKWQIELETHLKDYPSIVLFGAGNMCRNYMKCYGEQYTPLFTCDNNSALWGTTFCGLEVKNPECLQSLPEDCVVLICNIYYREIEKQLRDMGLPNTIAFFNDEYMPTFYFDRLEDGGGKGCCK